MNDFDGLFTSDFGLKPQGKSAPMAPPSKGSSNAAPLNFDFGSRSARASNSDSLFGSSAPPKSRDAAAFDDLLAGSDSRRADSPFDFDSMYGGPPARSTNSPPPVYDKPVYDDDIFDGVPGLKSTSNAKFDNVFASEGGGGAAAFDDLLGGFGKEPKSSGGKKPEKDGKGVSDFDDLLAGFGNSRSSSSSGRHTPDIGLSSEPTASASKTTSTVPEDPFKVFESASAPVDSPAGYFMDPLEEISKFSSSRSTRNDSSSTSNGKVYENIDPFDGLGKSVPAFSSERKSRKGSSSPRFNSSPSWTGDKEPADKISGRSPERHTQNEIPVENDQEFPQAPFHMPTYSSDSDKPVGQRSTSPPYNNDFRQANVQADMSPKYEDNLEASEDIWLTVSEIPLFTQPTTAPPPSRPPPPRPVHIPKSGTSSPASTNARKTATEFSSFPGSTRFSHGPKSAPAAGRVSPSSQFDELDDFAMGRSHGNDNESGNGLPDEELEMNSAAAAMKEAMDRAEAKFRHAKGVREREYSKAARSKEAVQMEKDERTVLEEREKQERLDHERQQKEREEKEQRRLVKEREEKEREQRLEREKARQAVERATREARERAAVEARQRAERAAVEKANAEARARAERAAVQRAQAEARERAAAEAKERAEKAAAEAKEREARERGTAARAEAEARVKAERAAVERAAAEARERAAAEARERAAAAARMNQQKNENDLESFFGMGSRATSAPRPPRANSSDSVFESQFQSDVTRKSTSASTSMKKASSSTNIVDDLSSIFGAAPSSSGEFQDVEGETEERRRARLERHQRAQERAAKALAEKNQRDLQTQREQAERQRFAETLDFEIKRWAAGKEGNLRALLSTLQYVLWPECGWQPVSLTDLITAAAVKKAYRKATLCIHPDKVQQKGANLQQKYIAAKVFDLLKFE
ncbi:Auxilin-related protein 2, partial [Mucuna pruriens]